MSLGFGGEVAHFYQRYRRGYPAAVFDALVDAFALTVDDIVLDLGCGTGQLALPIAARVRAVVGVDPEPDMLVCARQAGTEQGVTNVSWMLGADTDLPAAGALLGGRTVGAITIGQALHWMDYEALFQNVALLTRDGGGVAVVTNGTPLWLQESAWSRALRGCLEQWLGRKLTQPAAPTPRVSGGTATADRRWVRRGRNQRRLRRRDEPRAARRRCLFGILSRPTASAGPAAEIRRAGPPSRTPRDAIP